VVDDSITVREVERQLLLHRGYDVSIAVDGMEGWNKVRSEKFDLLVSDIDMPRMSGLQLVSAVRGDEKLRDLPVVIVSYKERDEDRMRGLEVGANCYLTKSSFHDNRFIEAVEDLIGTA
jgi:two-component system sensor histidine kinase and response regulator WspE